MPRYIDADDFCKTMIKRFGCVPCLTDYSDTSRYDIPIDDALKLEPTADVVPRAEIIKILNNEFRRCEKDEVPIVLKISRAILELKNKLS